MSEIRFTLHRIIDDAFYFNRVWINKGSGLLKNGWGYYVKSRIHFKDGLWHREDGPAVIFDNPKLGVAYYYADVCYDDVGSDLEWLCIVNKLKKGEMI